jgi:hypothetical protein
VGIWQEVATAASECVDGTFGEIMQIIPMIAGRYAAPTADPDRSTRTVTMVYREKPIDKLMLDESPGMGRAFASELKVESLSIDIQTSALCGENGVLNLPQKGDRIVRTEIAGTPMFEVTSTKPDGAVRTILFVVKVSA